MNETEERVTAMECVAEFLNGTRNACELSNHDHTENACKMAIERLQAILDGNAKNIIEDWKEEE